LEKRGGEKNKLSQSCRMGGSMERGGGGLAKKGEEVEKKGGKHKLPPRHVIGRYIREKNKVWNNSFG